MKLSNIKYDGHKVIACEMDGVAVAYVDKSELTADDWCTALSRAGAGGLILGAFFPGVGHAAGILGGAASAFWQKLSSTAGYYNKSGNLVYSGQLTKSDLNVD